MTTGARDQPMAERRGTCGRAGPSRAEIAARIVFWIGAFLFLGYLFVKSWELSTGDPSLESRRIDFIAFWGAARLALAGEALAAFDPAALAEASGLASLPPGNLLWLYPPGFLAMVTPFGALPFWTAWSAFSLLSAAGLALAARRPAAPVPGGWRLVVVSPVVLVGCLAVGQTGVLWTAVLVAALYALRQRDAVAAGLAIALLTLKPQLGLLIPVALLAGREWRTLGWATAFAALLALAATLPFGPVYWDHFLTALAEATDRLEAGTMPLARLVSAYGFARASGLGHAASLAAQVPVTVFLAVSVAWIWSRRAVGPDLKAALLCAAIPLATPYAFYYEMPLVLAAGLFLVRDGFGRGTLAKLWLLVLWCGPVPALYLPSLATVALAAPPIALGTVVICLIRAGRATLSGSATPLAGAT